MRRSSDHQENVVVTSRCMPPLRAPIHKGECQEGQTWHVRFALPGISVAQDRDRGPTKDVRTPLGVGEGTGGGENQVDVDARSPASNGGLRQVPPWPGLQQARTEPKGEAKMIDWERM